MKNEEILQKAIEKAEKLSSDNAKRVIKDFNLIGYGGKLSLEGKGYIFSHSFAKAFWGSIPVCRDCKGSIDKDNKPQNGKYCSQGWHEAYSLLPWQFHLQRMVLEENPLEYLAKFLKGK